MFCEHSTTHNTVVRVTREVSEHSSDWKLKCFYIFHPRRSTSCRRRGVEGSSDSWWVEGAIWVFEVFLILKENFFHSDIFSYAWISWTFTIFTELDWKILGVVSWGEGCVSKISILKWMQIKPLDDLWNIMKIFLFWLNVAAGENWDT